MTVTGSPPSSGGMVLSEALNAGAVTTMTFKSSARRKVWDDLHAAATAEGAPRDAWVAVFDQRPASFNVPNLIERARWIGQPLRELDNGFELMTAPAMFDVPNHNVLELVPFQISPGLTWSTLKATQARFGTVDLSADPGGTWPAGADAGTRRLAVLSAAARHFGVSWKLDRRARFVSSINEVDVFPTTPVLAVVDTRHASSDEVNGIPLRAGSFPGYAGSVGHHATTVVARLADGTSAAPSTQAVGFTPTGDDWAPARLLDMSGVTDISAASALATAAAGRYDPATGPRRTFNVRIPASNRPLDVRPGDTVWAISERLKITDPAAAPVKVPSLGLVRPRSVFVTGVDASTHQRMCVAVWRSGPGVWEEPISDQVELGDGSMTIRLDSELANVIDETGITQPTPILRETNTPAATAAALDRFRRPKSWGAGTPRGAS